MKHKREISAVMGIIMLLLQFLIMPTLPLNAVIHPPDTTGDIVIAPDLYGNLGKHPKLPLGISNIELYRYPGAAPGNLDNNLLRNTPNKTLVAKAFCVEPYVRVNLPFINKFCPSCYQWTDSWGSSTQKRMLGRIAWYGWEKSDHTERDQAITQAAIWQYLDSSLTGGFTDKSGRSLTDDINGVLEKANNHTVVPKFSGTGWDESTRTLTMKPGAIVTLTPSPGSPDVSNSELISAVPTDISISTNGNSIIVSSTESMDTGRDYEIKLSRIKLSEADLSTHFLVHSNSQDIMVTGGIDPAVYDINIQFEASAELEITKTDHDTGKPLDGAEFQIQDSKGQVVKVKEVSPGQYTALDGTLSDIKTLNGKALVTGLPEGNYQVVEVKTPEYYAKPANASHPVVLENGALSRLQITNTELPAELKILKVDRDSGERIPIPGVKFSLYTTVTGGTPVAVDGKTVFTTDENGSVSLGKLKSGTYYIEETSPPEGYLLPTSRTKIDLQPGSSIEIKIDNTSQVGKILIEKTGPALTSYRYEELIIDKPEKEELHSVTVEVPSIFTEEPEITHELPVDQVPDETDLTEPEMTEEIESTDPEITTNPEPSKVPANSDIEAPTKGEIDAQEEEQAVQESSKPAAQAEIAETPGVEASSEATEEALEPDLHRRYFGLRASLSAAPSPSPVEESESSAEQAKPTIIDLVYQVINLETNSIVLKVVQPVDGALQLELRNGRYAAESMNKPGEPVVEFEVNEPSEVEQEHLQKLIPIFSEDQNLKDAVFEVYADEDIYSQAAKLVNGQWNRILLHKKGTLVDTVTTGADGTALTKELPLGCYLVKETKAPLGYTLNPEASIVEIKQEGQVSRIVQETRTFTNTRQKLKVSFEKTFEESQWFEYHKDAPEKTLFGLYTVDAYTENGITIPAGSLIETSGLKQNEEGQWIAEFEPLFAGSFRLVELHTSESYNLADPVSFTLDYTSNAETSSKVLDEIQNELVKGNVEVVKVDSDDERPIANVTFELIKLNDDGSEEVIGVYETDEDGQINVQNLEYGKYIFQEVSRPDGYATPKKDRHDITIDSSGQLIEVRVENEPTQVRITKKRLIDEEELPGAHLSLRDSQGNLIAEWISGDEPYEIKRLKIGETYTLTEDLAPLGYATAQSISFTILDTGEIQAVTMFNDLTWVDILKVDGVTEETIAGAELELINPEGESISTWISTSEPYTVRGLAVGETYTIKELNAPTGYASTTEVTTFMVEDSREIQAVTFANDEIRVELSKTDITTGEELPGAKLSLRDSDGKLIEEWTSSEKPHIITKLHVGETYTLTEDLAPLGYAIAQSISFTVQDTAEVQKVVMKDEINRVTLKKTDIITEEPVPGAKVIIRNEDGEIVYEEFTDEDGNIKIEKIPTGTYTFQEEVHPEGYILNTESFTFTVEPDGSTTGTTDFTNEPTSLKVLKTDGQGRPLSGAEFELRKRGTGDVIRARIEDGIYIANANGSESRLVTDAKGVIEIRYLPQGQYDLVEVKAPEGYQVNRKIHQLSIGENHGITNPSKITVMNRPIERTVPGAGDDLGKYFSIAILGVTGFASLIYGVVIRKRQNEHQ